MKRPASQNKRGGGLRMAFRVRKVFGTFEKRAPAGWAWVKNNQTQPGATEPIRLIGLVKNLSTPVFCQFSHVRDIKALTKG